MVCNTSEYVVNCELRMDVKSQQATKCFAFASIMESIGWKQFLCDFRLNLMVIYIFQSFDQTNSF